MHTCEEARESAICLCAAPQEFNVTGQFCNIMILLSQIPAHSSTGSQTLTHKHESQLSFLKV